ERQVDDRSAHADPPVREHVGHQELADLPGTEAVDEPEQSHDGFRCRSIGTRPPRIESTCLVERQYPRPEQPGRTRQGSVERAYSSLSPAHPAEEHAPRLQAEPRTLAEVGVNVFDRGERPLPRADV